VNSRLSRRRRGEGEGGGIINGEAPSPETRCHSHTKSQVTIFPQTQREISLYLLWSPISPHVVTGNTKCGFARFSVFSVFGCRGDVFQFTSRYLDSLILRTTLTYSGVPKADYLICEWNEIKLIVNSLASKQTQHIYSHWGKRANKKSIFILILTHITQALNWIVAL